VSAGFGIKGIQNQFLSSTSLREYRGLSFSIGGDPNATTVANMVFVYYILKRKVTKTLIFHLFNSSNDMFNAAQSGAHSSDLQHELDYLLPKMQKQTPANQSGWKMLNVFIGSNDLCAICEEGLGSPTEYGQNILAALERIRSTVDNVFVNLSTYIYPIQLHTVCWVLMSYFEMQQVGMIHVDQIYKLTDGSDYCEPFRNSSFVLHDYECPCAHSAANQTIMAQNVELYNQALQSVYYTYKAMNFPTFAVAYQPLPVDILSFPITAISNIDCFHPSLMAHQWLAKMIWNMFYMQQAQKPSTLIFDPAAPVYCPMDTDRIQIL
ncbi:hypothetical protein INT43_004381, partial [Umbelopsis isabellina]